MLDKTNQRFIEVYKPDFSKLPESIEDITLEQYKYLVEELELSGRIIEIIYGKKSRYAERIAKRFKGQVNINRTNITRKSNLYFYGVESTNSLQSTKDKTKQSMNKRYGGWFNNSEKAKQTCLKKYGAVTYTASKEGKEKVKETILKNNNGLWNFQTKEFREQANKTILEKYGSEKYRNIDSTKKTKLERYGNEYYNNKEKASETISQRTIEERKIISQKVLETKKNLYGEDYTNRNKYRETCLSKYGVINPFQLDEVKEKIRQTNLEKYGVEFFSQTQEFSNKVKNTMFQRYGVEYYNNYEKSLITKLERYGDKNYNNRDKAIQTNFEKYGRISSSQIHIPIESVKILHDKNSLKSLIEELTVTLGRKPTCNDLSEKLSYKAGTIREKVTEYGLEELIDSTGIRSVGEIQLYEFIRENYSGKIETNDRKALSGGRELDIYLPEIGIAFEFNGEYWHKNILKDKSKREDASEKGIKVYTIWNSEWKSHNESIKKWVYGIICEREKIFAKTCIVKEISNEVLKEFISENYYEDIVVNEGVYLGLYHNEELVYVSYFSYLTKDSYEMVVIFGKKDYMVVGGADRLIRHFIKNYKFKVLYAVQDTNRYIGEMYIRNGFELLDSFENEYFCNGYEMIPVNEKHREEYNSNCDIKEWWTKVFTLPILIWGYRR